MNKRVVVSAAFVIIVIVVIVSFTSYQANLIEMHDRDKVYGTVFSNPNKRHQLVSLENGSPPY